MKRHNATAGLVLLLHGSLGFASSFTVYVVDQMHGLRPGVEDKIRAAGLRELDRKNYSIVQTEAEARYRLTFGQTIGENLDYYASFVRIGLKAKAADENRANLDKAFLPWNTTRQVFKKLIPEHAS